MTSDLVTVVLADDHPVVLSGLKSLIQHDPMFHVLLACPDGASALEAIRQTNADIAVLDMSMPRLTGLEVLQTLEAEMRTTRIVFLTASASDEQIVEAVSLGVHGMMLKDAAADALLDCLRIVAAGGRWLASDLVAPAIEREEGRRVEIEKVGALTTRERELVLLVAEGRSNKDIARKIGVTEGTVKIHLHNIYQKLGVANRTAMTTLVLSYRDRISQRACRAGNS